ncbi:HugZ family protein [Rhodoferax sp. PAMC 29310]|uniref:HugZ family pyridoxamine 5'-phosphate oxidase n=1 Tax=Rhodoferax sp. PAMC 29310 TaxID=2822760 RepID=UPI001B331AE6|nr:pyridoxamine 5'-phosphate oxidase family protein [Rhodoferax sp. PAMC 29310]
MSPDTPHDSRLNQSLRALLTHQRVAALGSLGDDGAPFVSMVPFAVDPISAVLVIHVSGLAPHTHQMLARPQVSMMVMQKEAEDASVLSLPRVTFQGLAEVIAVDNRRWAHAKQAYLTRFPEAEPMTHFGDFMFIGIAVTTARHVAGFGAARSLDANEVASVLKPLH